MEEMKVSQLSLIVCVFITYKTVAFVLGVRILAKRLVEQWLKIVTENPGCATTTSSPAGAVEPKENSAGSADSVSNMEHSSSDSTDSGGAGPATQNYTITSGERKRNLVITIKTVDKSATAAASADSLYNDDDSSLPATEAGAETSGSIESSERSMLDDSSTTRELKSGEDADADKKQKSPRDKSKRSEKDRDKDRKSSSSSSSGHRSSSSHKSSSSSSSSSKSSSKSSSSSSHRSSSDKHRDKDKSRSSSSSSSSKDKDRKDGLSSSSSSSKHKSSKSSSSSSSSSSKDRSREKEKEKSSSSGSKREHEKDSKMMPPPPTASEKKPKEGEVDAQKPKSISIPSRKASISIEIRRDTEKTATVKTYQSKFRSHGLTEEAPPPPSRKGLKKPTSTVPPPSGTTLIAPLSLKRPSPPPRDSTPVEKKPKIDINNVSGHVDRPGSVKLIAPKKSKHEQFEYPTNRTFALSLFRKKDLPGFCFCWRKCLSILLKSFKGYFLGCFLSISLVDCLGTLSTYSSMKSVLISANALILK